MRPSALAKKINPDGLWPILACSVPTSGSPASSLRSADVVKNFGGVADQFRLPLRDLVRVHIILGAQFGRRLITPDRGLGELGLEYRRMIPPGPFHLLCSCCAHAALSFEQNFHLAIWLNFRSHFLFTRRFNIKLNFNQYNLQDNQSLSD